MARKRSTSGRAKSQATRASNPKFKGIGADKVNGRMPRSGF